MEERYRLGIDFGTTYCCVGVWKDGGIEIIPNGIGERTTPSVVIFDSPNKVYVGEETLNHLSKKDSVKIYEIKRLIGKKYTDIEKILNYFPFKVEQKDLEDKPIIKMSFDNGETRECTPEEISFLIFQKLISNAENYLNQKISEVIITVPADFNDIQRYSIKSAAELNEGIKVIQIINEPNAAVLSYGFPNKLIKDCIFPINQNYTMINEPKVFHPMEEMLFNNGDNLDNNIFLNLSLNTYYMNNKEKEIIVFDLGGGTYDVSLIEITDFTFETKCSEGDQYLGGGDFDNKLMEFCLEFFCSRKKIPLDEIKSNYKCIQRLKIACEQTKKILSIRENDTIYIEDFYKEETLSCQITRAKFEDLCKEYFDKLMAPIDKVLNFTKKTVDDINEIILVGGSSKIPKIKEILKDKFKNSIINDSINPDEAVAYGATLYCESLFRNEGEFWEDFQFLDSTQHSYGIEIEDGSMEIILPKGSKYPTSVTRYFFNAYDDQYTFIIKVYQGEEIDAYDNELIGEFTLKNIPKKPKGQLALTITFSIDSNQILNVYAYVAEGDIKKSIQIKRNQRNETLILGKVSLYGNELSKEEKRLKFELFDYSKNFRNVKSQSDKLNLIKNYNKSVNDYLKFLEDKYNDIDSEKYLFLVEKLFKSYSYFYKTELFSMIDLKEKYAIKKKIENYLEKINKKNPFRLKQLLINFKDIKKTKSDIFYTTSIYAMELLKIKGDAYFSKKDRNSFQIAKNIYEESLLIGKSNVKDSVYSLDIEIYRNYLKITEECENNIKIISLDSHCEIENTKMTGILFRNDYNLDYDSLCLLSFNLSQSLKIFNTIDNLNDNKEALESKCICLAIIVKIEFSLKKRSLSLQNLLKHAEESISIAKKLGPICTTKNWYNEIISLKEDIKKNLNPIPAPSIEDIEIIRKEFENKYQNGVDEFIKFLLTNYPYDNIGSIDTLLEKYQKNKKAFILDLKKKYKKFFNNKNTLTLSDNTINQKKEEIDKYLNNCINDLNSER